MVRACSLRSSDRSTSVATWDSFLVEFHTLLLMVGKPIFVGITISIMYVSENGVAPVDLQRVVR